MATEIMLLLLLATTIGMFVFYWRKDHARGALLIQINKISAELVILSNRVLELENEKLEMTLLYNSQQIELTQMKNDFFNLAQGTSNLIDQLMKEGLVPVYHMPNRFKKPPKPKDKLIDLHRSISDSFDIDELQEIVFEMGLDWTELQGEKKGLKIISLVLLVKRSELLDKLLDILSQKRENINWEQYRIREL